MKDSLSHEFRYLVPAWLGSVLLPWPALLLWRSDDGLALALGLFFVGAAGLVAYSFRRDVSATAGGEFRHPLRRWRTRMVAVTAALLADWVAFSAVHLALNDQHDFVSVLLALSALVPACCIVPYLTQVTRKPFAAVVFTVFLVACMKLLGCVVVVLVYGWDASERGHTTMPWARPNLLVWLFWVNTGVLSLACYCLGVRRFRERTAYAAAPGTVLSGRVDP
jgi:hypothetical protein